MSRDEHLGLDRLDRPGAGLPRLGAAKLNLPPDKLRTAMPWSEDFAPPQVKLIGVAEILGALGLVLPSCSTWSTHAPGSRAPSPDSPRPGWCCSRPRHPTHVRRGEARRIPVNIVLLALAAFVAAARFGWF